MNAPKFRPFGNVSEKKNVLVLCNPLCNKHALLLTEWYLPTQSPQLMQLNFWEIREIYMREKELMQKKYITF